MRVMIHVNEGEPIDVPISDEALAKVNAQVNPSGLEAVDRIKLLFAACISEIEVLTYQTGQTQRCAEIAIQRAEEAAMWAVKSLTAEKAPHS